MKHNIRSALIIISCCILLYIAVKPIFSPYIVGTADGLAHKYRLVNFNKSISEGILHPRWVEKAVLGYGAPLYIFNYSVPYYIVDMIYRSGYSIQTASQIYAAFTIIATALAMYALASLLWGKLSGTISAITYTFAPYHLHTVYSYESWGEMLAFLYPPLLLYLLISLFHVQESNSIKHKIYYVLTIITWVLFIMTHNISSYITSPIVGLLALVCTKHSRHTYITFGKIVLLVLLISCFFILPAITQTNTIKIADLMKKEFEMRQSYMITLVDQLRLSWSASAGQPVTYKAFTIGIPIFMTLLISIIAITRSIFTHLKRAKKIVVPPLVYTLIGLLLISLALVDPITYSVYEIRPLQYVLYPYRFLFLATFVGSILTGYLYRKSIATGICVIILTVLFGYPFAHPRMDVFSFSPSFFEQPQMLGYAIPTLKTMGIAEFLPATANIDFIVSEEFAYRERAILPKKFIIPSGSGTIISHTIKPESISATINANSQFPLIISTLYYKNWRATIDNVSSPVTHDQYGRIVLTIPKGVHRIHLYFGYSTIELIGICLSLLGIVLLAVSLVI